MTAHVPDDPPGRTLGELRSRGLEPRTSLDGLVIGLTILDLILLSVPASVTAFLPAIALQVLGLTNLVIATILILELVVNLSRAHGKVRFLITHWYDVVGSLPLANPLFRAFRLVRVLRLYIVSKCDVQEESTWISALVRNVLLRYLDVFLTVLTRPLLHAMVKIIDAPLRKARLAAMLGKILDTQRDQIRDVALVSLRATKPTKPFAESGFGKKSVDVVTNAVLDSVVEILESKEVNELLANSVHSVLIATTDGMTNVASAGRADAEAPAAATP